MKLMLEAKHWQLFLVYLGLYLLGTRAEGYVIEAFELRSMVLLCWMLSIGIYGQKVLAAKNIAPSSTGLFCFNIIYQLIFLVVLGCARLNDHHPHYFWQETDAFWWLTWGYAIYALIQTIWFTGRTLAYVENEGEYAWGTSFVYCLLVVFHFVGLWVIQPIVNKWIPGPWYLDVDQAGKDPGKNKINPY